MEQNVEAERGCPKPLEDETKDEKDEENHALGMLDETVEDEKLPENDWTTIVRRKVGVDIDDINNIYVFVVLNHRFIK